MPVAHRSAQTRASTRYEIAEQLADADLVIGSVLIPGAAAPKLVTDEMVAAMKPGSVLVDKAIDQGGCSEGSHPTTHDDPTFPVHQSLYYCVANMPGQRPTPPRAPSATRRSPTSRPSPTRAGMRHPKATPRSLAVSTSGVASS